jgi:hypothetical protein
MNLRPFTDVDYFAFAGVEKFDNEEPMIAYPGGFVVTVGGCPEDKCPLVFVSLPEDRNNEGTSDYCYIPCHGYTWREAVQVAETIAKGLAEGDLAWVMTIATLAEST